MKSSPFQIINAAAGSGKTYALVFDYLKKLLSTHHDDGYRRMLALTFTNKAVNEMKFRILDNLYLLAHHIEKDKIRDIRSSLLEDLKIDLPSLQQKAQRILNKILHEYAAFEVITLDRFTHKIIKSFAKDLKIPASFEVTLDSDLLLQEMTENILDQAGIDKPLTETLVSFSLSKIEELKSWNIGEDLFDFSKLLLNENDREPLSVLRKIDQKEFKAQKKAFQKDLSTLREELKTIGINTLQFLNDQGLDEDDFNRKTLYTHFEKIASGTVDDLYKNQLEQNLTEGQRLYKKSLSESKKNIIDALTPELLDRFTQAKSKVGRLLLLKSIISQWTPLSLIGSMEKGLEDLQLPENRLLLSRFNEMIDNEISGLDAPYIYERLGEKYRYYFIDEFQDTSRLQWKNLIPLISNALQGLDDDHQMGSLLLVGDPKQAIYRWRGGDNQQFLNLLKKESPFPQLLPDITLLPKNYRSQEAIVDFNNRFFAWVGALCQDPEQKEMFEQQTQQEFNDKKGGQVVVRFIEKGRQKESTIPHYQEQTIISLNAARSNGFLWKDMAVLVRKKEQAAQIAEALQTEDIPLISSESLSLGSSLKVNFLIALIRVAVDPDDEEQRKNIIKFLYDYKGTSIDFDQSLSSSIFLPLFAFEKEIKKQFNLSFDFQLFAKKSLYNAIEYAIAAFQLIENMEAHLNSFLDDVFEFSTKDEGSFLSYLHYWEQKGKDQKIVIPEGTNAVKILTIHKAKGLEFPVVVLPFASEDLVSSRSQKVWYPIKNHFDTSFSWGRIHFSNKLKYLGAEATAFYERQLLAEQGDALNTFYVALTRAVSQLHLICTIEQESAPMDKSYATLLNHFVRSQNQSPETERPFEWGTADNVVRIDNESPINGLRPDFKFQPNWQKRLWVQMHPRHNESAMVARKEGLLVHDLLAELSSTMDTSAVVTDALHSGKINKEEYDHYLQMVNDIVDHPQLSPFYQQDIEVYNEKDILIPQKSFVRPDRVVKNKDGWVIIDYKTGKEHPRHANQIKHYAEVLEEMTHEKSKCFLVYIGKKTIVKTVA
ncbi:UvrD-helicase domain-containing protein [Flavobacteriaceae bacterium]|nr:UvrD-helicase domain-containing protein [Flavobacteriaceae bacterium]MDC0478702.1 UvrD-helicase domain-containing protein [Flavobacteriaceae bacterium]